MTAHSHPTTITRSWYPFDKNDATNSDATAKTPPTTTTASQQRQLLEEEAIAQVLTFLRRIFPNTTIPSPVASHVTSWGSDEYAGGAYGFAKVKSTERTYQDMMAPVGGCLYFVRVQRHIRPSMEHGRRDNEKRNRYCQYSWIRNGNDNECHCKRLSFR